MIAALLWLYLALLGALAAFGLWTDIQDREPPLEAAFDLLCFVTFGAVVLVFLLAAPSRVDRPLAAVGVALVVAQAWASGRDRERLRGEAEAEHGRGLVLFADVGAVAVLLPIVLVAVALHRR